MWKSSISVLAATLTAPVMASGLAVEGGTLVVEPPTLIALGFELPIKGDENRNATVEVSYRKEGTSQWHDALPLLRLGGEQIKNGASFNIETPNMFAGSVFDLEPDTAYEVRLKLQDPDGVKGQAEHLIKAKTRAEPMPAEGGNVYHVYPRDYKGEKQQPAFTSLLAAYNTGANGADWVNSFVPRVKPGDTILVHAGVYRDNRRAYGGGNSTLFDGTMYLTADGTPDKPIVIKAAGDGEVIFDGDGNAVLFDLTAADYNYFEGITVRNTETAFQLGRKRIAGSVGFTLKNSKLENVGRGVYTDYGGARDFYIADNVFVGRNDPNHLMGWSGRVWREREGFPQKLYSEYAVKVYGSGHVIAHNYVANFHDGIDHATYGDPDDWPNTPRDRMPVALDIYNNDILNIDDNCIEADAVMHNARVLRNRCFSTAHRALSTQPALGGPIYFVRNIVYHAPEGGVLKLTANSSGVLVYNNTFLSEVIPMGPISNVHFRNNLVLGQGASPGGPGDAIVETSPWPEIFSVDTFTAYSSSDYNGFAPNKLSETSFTWKGPQQGADYTGERSSKSFKNLSGYSSSTKQDRHSRIVGWDIFVNAAAPSRAEPGRVWRPNEVDLQLRAKSAAVDAGVVLPGVTDGYLGKAPDLGALEHGAPLPIYGPRPRAASSGGN